MSIINETSKILDATARVLNEAAFGDVRNIFGNRDMYDFRTRPIGLYGKSYDFMLWHLYRNIGNGDYTYDGYSTPIGEMANPFYNTIVRVPWFYNDVYKNATANYLDYIRNVYGATLSVENINEVDLFHISDEASSVGYTDGIYAIEALVNNTDLIPNNNTYMDTRLGMDSGYYNRETLRNAVVSNDERDSYGFGITSNLGDFFGITTKNITETRNFARSTDIETGRYVDGTFSPLENVDSPIEVSNYGHIADIGSYIGYYNSLSDKSKKYFESNALGDDRTYRPLISENGNVIFKGKTYLGKIGVSVGHDRIKNNKTGSLEAVAIDELQIRYVFSTLEEHSNVSDIKNGGVYVYAEDEYGSSPNITYASFNSGARFGRYTSYSEGLTATDLLKKTNDAFKNGSYKTIIARFHTDYDESENTDTTQTAVSGKYGMSHGRNLLKVTPDKSEGYDNPYCRVWTYHHQYHRLADAIRPIGYSAEELYNKYNFKLFTADNSSYGFENGRVRLEKFGSINKNNGLVNITPIDTSDLNKKVDIKNCMFSIENLAWKDSFGVDGSSRASFQAGGLSSEQKGPFGGRIMWFPPYDLKFNEDINVNWNETNFIGRGEGIYTYTNTTRTGNMSFKLLVDHPSIINYWENRGKSSSNSVDDIDDPEQQLLRFFAGCDMLTGKPESTPEPKPATYDEPEPSPDLQLVKFFVFYPNNYSGVDDGPDFAMKYLTNGLGAGEMLSEVGKNVRYNIPYANVTSGTNNNGDSIKGYGGYEMRAGKPISLGATQTETLKIAQDVKVGNSNEITMYAKEGNSTNPWWKRKWYYRVDNSLKNEVLLKENYLDSASSCLNSIAGKDIVAEKLGVEDKDNLYSLSDFYIALEGGDVRNVLKDVYSDDNTLNNVVNELLNKIGGTAGSNIDHIDCVGWASLPGYKTNNKKLASNRAETVAQWLRSKLSIDSNKIKSKAGDKDKGEGAGINKGDDNALINKIWRSTEVNIYLKKSESKTVQDSLSEGYVNLGTNETPDYNQTNYLNGNNDGNIETVFTDLSANRMIAMEHIKDRIRSVKLNHLNDSINNLALNLRGSYRNGNLNVNSVAGAIADFSEHYKKFQYDNLGNIINNYGGKAEPDNNVAILHDNAAKDFISLNNSEEEKTEETMYGQEQNSRSSNGSIDNKVTRYDNESKFFSMLEREEPFLHHKISDKIKYFDPAFHSISPEGFNARLTFLQQCTRQGPTIGNSDNGNDTTANNLSFGRPPVCILRLGDFYYTKIIIEQISFSFDPLVWDLNTEGIGVMPMIADINMRFRFIGGSSLAGHITRLQNALSFNYYANTEVYDNRSELADYDENGNIDKFKPNPLTPTIN